MIRHAKAGWGGFAISDFERPLESSGMKDAENMGLRLRNKNIQLQQFISSTALRARMTAEIISENYFGKEIAIDFHNHLYHASPAVIAHSIASLNDQWDTVAVVGHNPGITEYVNNLVDNVRIDDMPTCGLFAVAAECDKWDEWANTPKSFLFFDYPQLR